jgi:hypothetical protein
LEHIQRDFPRIRIYGNWEVAQRVLLFKTIATAPFKLKDGTTVTPAYGKHDVEVTFYDIEFPDGLRCFYATDTCEVHNPTGKPYDYILCEANYDEHKLNAIGMKYASHGYDPWKAAYRHLSVRQCKAFYYGNRKSMETPLIELHCSERFR